MVSSTKILTVSYGTFSCTAEGFEDPLGVVKQTTQFFHGVVQEDRFFGAEPPRVDSELAGELLRNQISADRTASGLTLRPVLSGTPPETVPDTPATPATVPGAAFATDDIDAAASDAADLAAAEAASRATLQDTPAGLDDIAPEAGADWQGDPDGELEELAALDGIAPPTARPEEPVAQDTMVDDIVANDTVADDDLREGAFDEHDAYDPTAEPSSDEDTLEGADMDSGWDDWEPVEAPATPAGADSIAARLDRIRAVVGQYEAEAESAKQAEAASESAPETDDLDALLGDILTSGAGDTPAAEVAPSEPAAPANETVEVAPVAPEAPARRAPRIRARVVKVKRADFERAVASGDLEEIDEDAPADRPEMDEVDDRPATTLSAEEEDELARELAAVRAELEEEWDDDEDDMPAAATSAPLRLDHPVAGDDAAAAARNEDEDDEEEDLAERLARESVRKTVKLSSPGRAMLTEGSVDDGDNTSRLLHETNRELEEPEGNRRRSAIAHLRAAVAATRADRLLGRKPDEAKETEPYREDLATVVRPRRPQAVAPDRRPRPAQAPQSHSASAPLQLVAEQRVAAEGDSGPVRPRRVRPEAEPAAARTDSDGFRDYADSVGARALPELLEAAAAYMSFVERREQFSRPQLMSTVRQAEPAESSREDRLRSFGQLLREGKIEKTRGGRFTASERISFKPPRAAAG